LSDLNCFEIAHLKLYTSSCNSLSNKIIFKDFLRGSEIGCELFGQELFVKMSPPTSRGRNFLAFSMFLPIFSATDAARGELHLLFGHHKKMGRSYKNSEQTLP
jgi:hypothetical protein